MAVGLDADGDYLHRPSIPSGGAGTASDGAFKNCLTVVWLYRPSAIVTYALTAGGSIIDYQASARNVRLGFNSAGSLLSDLSLQITFNSGGGAGTPATFASHGGDDYLDQWVAYFVLDNSTDGQIAGYILLSDLASIADSITRANDNAGSQYINTLTIGNVAGGGAVVAGHYAYARHVYGSGLTTADALALAAETAPDAGDWGFWALPSSADVTDSSGNSRDFTAVGTLTDEDDPDLGPPPAGAECFASQFDRAMTAEGWF